MVTPAPDERTIYTSRLHDGVASAAWPVFSEPALAMLRSAGAELHPEPGEVLWEAGDPYHLDLVLGDEHVVGAGAGRLLCQEGVVALGEVLEVLVAAVGDRGREVGPVRQLERQDRRRVIDSQGLQLRHRTRLSSRVSPGWLLSGAQ